MVSVKADFAETMPEAGIVSVAIKIVNRFLLLASLVSLISMRVSGSSAFRIDVAHRVFCWT